MSYYINFKNKKLQGFKRKLKDTKLLPSQKVLEEFFENGFDYLEKLGVQNLYEVKEALKTKDKAQILAKQSSLPEKFWIVFRRELNGHHPQPRKLKDFSIIPERIVDRLIDSGIRTTEQLYYKICNKEVRSMFCLDFDISVEESLLLTKLTDFCRLRYVNPDFATLLVQSKYDTIKKLKTADFKELHAHLTDLNNDKEYFKGKISLNDMELIIRDANYIDTEINLD